MLHVYAALAEKERRMIGKRTYSPLAAVRGRGVARDGHREQSDLIVQGADDSASGQPFGRAVTTTRK